MGFNLKKAFASSNVRLRRYFKLSSEFREKLITPHLRFHRSIRCYSCCDEKFTWKAHFENEIREAIQRRKSGKYENAFFPFELNLIKGSFSFDSFFFIFFHNREEAWKLRLHFYPFSFEKVAVRWRTKSSAKDKQEKKTSHKQREVPERFERLMNNRKRCWLSQSLFLTGTFTQHTILRFLSSKLHLGKVWAVLEENNLFSLGMCDAVYNTKVHQREGEPSREDLWLQLERQSGKHNPFLYLLAAAASYA